MNTRTIASGAEALAKRARAKAESVSGEQRAFLLGMAEAYENVRRWACPSDDETSELDDVLQGVRL